VKKWRRYTYCTFTWYFPHWPSFLGLLKTNPTHLYRSTFKVSVLWNSECHVSNEKEGPWLFRGFVGAKTTELYGAMGIIINHYNDPYYTTSIMESKSFFFFVAQILGTCFQRWVFSSLSDRWDAPSLHVPETRKKGADTYFICIFFCCNCRNTISTTLYTTIKPQNIHLHA